MKYALIVDDKIVEIIQPFMADVDIVEAAKEDGAPAVVVVAVGQEVPLSLRFHPDFLAMLQQVPDDAVVYSNVVETTPEEFAAAVRAERDRRLVASDWTDGRSVADDVFEKWKPYRQALRDLPTQKGFPMKINWPVEPT